MPRPPIRNVLLFRLWLAVMGWFCLHWSAAWALEPESAAHFADRIRPLLARVCGDCHAPDDPENSVKFLQANAVEDLNQARSLWHSVAEQLRNRTMPPADHAQPTEDERLELATWIEATLRATACHGGEFAGAVTPRRLNRYEYECTIRDLLGVEYRASESFPTDGSGGEGFNNNGETLYLPPLLLERYLQAAGEILDQVVISPPLALEFGPDEFLPPPSSEGATFRALSTGGEASIVATTYRSSDYSAEIRFRTGSNENCELLLQVDGIDAERWTVDDKKRANREERTTIHLPRGQHSLTVKNRGPATIELVAIELAGSEPAPSPKHLQRHARLLFCRPGEPPQDRRAGARQVLERFASQAFRRPVQTAEVDKLLRLYDRAADRGDPFEECVKLALKGVLVSPHFLFRIEAKPQSEQVQPLGDHELAVRLSYFLWSTQPDDELRKLADAGRLNTPEELRRQVDRMLDDPRSAALADQFVGQWLGTHEVGARVAPSTDVFEKEFTSELLLDLHDEPVYFFQHLIATDGRLLDLLDCDYAIVNRRLAKHYGLEGEPRPIELADNPRTSDPKRREQGPFQQVSLPDDRRGGVLGMGGVHMLTSYPDRTSPVLRGGWVLETLLGVRVPSPPPDVPELKRNKKSKQSLREQLAQHRDNPTCAACHNLMDPLGFALENFDVLGRWRERDGESPIDASAALPSGEEFSGPAGLREVLMARKSEFTRQATRKLLGYALGRSLEDADDCTVQKLSDDVEREDYRVRTLIQSVVLSTPFRNQQASP